MNSLGIQPFGEILRKFRERMRPKISQQKLADALHVNRQAVVAWERGDNPPKDRTRVLEIAKYLHLDDEETNELLQGALLDPLPPWHVPFHRNLFFTGRNDILRQLHNTLLPGAVVALTQPQALSGLGGVGKTHTAIEYAYRYRGEFSAVLWVQADSREILFSEFVKLGQLLNLSRLHEKDQNQIVSAVKRWLKMHKGWLLIFDNIEDLLLIEDFLPSDHQGCVLLTTRVAVTEPIASASELGEMTEKEGILFLLRRIKILTADASIDQVSQNHYILAKKIWDLMGGLPLAIDQAGAYILETGCSMINYLDLYQQQRAKLLRMRGKFSSGHPESVSTTFSLALEKVQSINNDAVELLHLCAFLHPEFIPEEIFYQNSSSLQASNPTNKDVLVFNQAVAVLKNHSLLYRDTENHALSLHRLVQEVIIDNMDRQVAKRYAKAAVQAIATIFPSGQHGTWINGERYLIQAQHSAETIKNWQLLLPEAGHLLNQTGFYLSEMARYREAELLYQQSLAIWKQLFGPDSTHVADVLSNLALLYHKLDKYSEAEILLQQVLSVREQQLGVDHPDVADVLDSLASHYHDRGKYTEAEPLYQRALTIRRQRLESDHPEIASSLNNIGKLHCDLGEYDQAEQMYRQAVTISEKQLGPDHPVTAIYLVNLASLYHDQEKYSEAESLYQRALKIREKQLGPDHPDLATSLNNLAELYRDQSKYTESEALHKRAHAIRERVLGPNHVETAQSLNNLGLLYQDQHKYIEAEPFYQQALVIWKQQLGDDHPDLATCLSNLAGLYRDQHEYAKAEILQQEVLAIHERKLGSNHLDTAQSLNDLALIYYYQGKYVEAQSLYQRAVVIYEQKLGVDNHHTKGVKRNYLILLQKLKQVEPRQQE